MNKQPMTVRELLAIIQNSITEHPEFLDVPVTAWSMTPEMVDLYTNEDNDEPVEGVTSELIDVTAPFEVWNVHNERIDPFFELMLRVVTEDGE
jgi:hypothetical protein